MPEKAAFSMDLEPLKMKCPSPTKSQEAFARDTESHSTRPEFRANADRKDQIFPPQNIWSNVSHYV
jgi:hypothetical protein